MKSSPRVCPDSLRRHWLTLLVAIAARTWRFGDVPAGLNIDEAIDEASIASFGRICVTDHVNYGLSYVYVLLAQRIDPLVYLQTAQIENPGDEFQKVASFGRYTFGLDLCRATPIGAYVIETAEIPSLPAGSYSLTSFNRYVVAVPREVGSQR